MKATNKHIGLILWYGMLIALLLCSSCGPIKKSVKNKNTKETLVQQFDKDSVNTKTQLTKETKIVSAPIEKTTGISLRTADSITNKRINEALRYFKFSDQSGNNKVSASYDEKTMQLLINAFVAQSIDKSKETDTSSEVNTNRNTRVEKTFEENVDEYIKKIKVPWWIYAIAVYLLRHHILALVGFFVPGIRQVKSINDLLNTKQSNS